MSTPVIVNETPIMMAELRETLKKNKKRDEELNFRAGKTEEYLNNFCSLKIKEAKELKEKIIALDVPRLKEEHAIKIVDLLPSTHEEVKSTLSNFPISINAENCKKIADLVKGYV